MGCSGDYKSLEKSTVFEVLREDGYSLSAMLYCVTNIPEIVRMVDLVTNHEADEETRQKINRLVQVMEVKGEERWREWMGFRETLGKVEVSPVKDSINWNNPTTITPKPSNLLDSKIA
jgi:acetolactate synthase small subunit